MKVLVTGANGQLGYDVIKRLNALGDEPVGADREEFDITDKKATEDYITALRPGAIVHCAAYTAVAKSTSTARETLPSPAKKSAQSSSISAPTMFSAAAALSRLKSTRRKTRRISTE